MIKVKKVEQYKYSKYKGECLVALGTLKCGSVGGFAQMMDIEEIRGKIRPVIISDSEHPVVGDHYYYDNTILKCMSEQERLDCVKMNLFKVLVFTEHFSQDHIRFMVDDKLKNDDKVFVECERPNEAYQVNQWQQITIKDNCVILHPVKKSNKKYTTAEVEVLIDQLCGWMGLKPHQEERKKTWIKENL